MDNASGDPLIFDIARCSMHDGPGIRTTVFLKGCHLRCRWCHNPESWAFGAEALRNPNTGTIRTVGTQMSIEAIVEVVKKDRAYYETSGGGLTISGGEPLLHPAFVARLARAAMEEGIHVAVETSGAVPWRNIEPSLPYIDRYLYDYKDSDSLRLRKNTGADLETVEANLDMLCKRGVAVTRRCPIVPGINDSEEHIVAICAESAKSRSGPYETEILLYHNLGASKCRSLDVPYGMGTARNLDNPEDVERVQDMITRYPHGPIRLKNRVL